MFIKKRFVNKLNRHVSKMTEKNTAHDNEQLSKSKQIRKIWKKMLDIFSYASQIDSFLKSMNNIDIFTWKLILKIF